MSPITSRIACVNYFMKLGSLQVPMNISFVGHKTIRFFFGNAKAWIPSSSHHCHVWLTCIKPRNNNFSMQFTFYYACFVLILSYFAYFYVSVYKIKSTLIQCNTHLDSNYTLPQHTNTATHNLIIMCMFRYSRVTFDVILYDGTAYNFKTAYALYRFVIYDYFLKCRT